MPEGLKVNQREREELPDLYSVYEDKNPSMSMINAEADKRGDFGFKAWFRPEVESDLDSTLQSFDGYGEVDPENYFGDVFDEEEQMPDVVREFRDSAGARYEIDLFPNEVTLHVPSDGSLISDAAVEIYSEAMDCDPSHAAQVLASLEDSIQRM